MKFLNEAARYSAPMVEVLDAEYEGVLCLSPSTDLVDWELDPDAI